MFSRLSFEDLTSESVKGTSLPLEGIDNIHSSDSLPLGMFGVGDGITDDVLKEDLEDTTGLLVDESRDTLDSSTSRQTADGGLGDALDVITKYLPVTLGASLAESLASFTTSSHCCSSDDTDATGGVGTILIADPALVAIGRVRNRVLHHPIMAGLAATQPYLCWPATTATSPPPLSEH